MRLDPTCPRAVAPRLLALGVSLSAALALAAPISAETAEAASRPRRNVTTISVDAGSRKGPVPTRQLGVNHRFVSDGHGMWQRDLDRPSPVVVRRLRRAGVNSVRYPGGIVGNLFDWKDAIGEDRGCQVHGQWAPQGFGPVRGNGYGPDEHMELVEAVGGEAVVMVPFVTETPRDAADWVEYMNSPADGEGGSNPNGGVDWAQRRAENGHPMPYGVRYWEVGNEQRVKRQRYWMSSHLRTAMRQYANGGSAYIEDEMLGRNCVHRNRGSRSLGTPNQVFELLYPPARPGSVDAEVLHRSGQEWHQVPSLADAGPEDRVYELDESEGELIFGDGVHGAMLPKGAQVRASYRSVHSGAFAFIRAMKQVDPRIKACVTWGLEEFIRVAGRRDYDCFSVHAYTHFRSEGTNRWSSPLEGHDRHMLGTTTERAFVAGIKRALPRGVSIALTEFGTIWGREDVYPEWSSSMTHATYMASMWVHWLDLGIPLAGGSDLLARSHRGLLGPAPDFTVSAEALTREAIKPLYQAGGRRLGVRVARNPARSGGLRAGSYPALAVAATRARNRDLYLLVVNRLPGASQRVRARVNLKRFGSRRVAFVTRVNGHSYRAWNTSKVTQVRRRSDRRRIGRTGFTEVFPAHSVTVIRVPARRRR